MTGGSDGVSCFYFVDSNGLVKGVEDEYILKVVICIICMMQILLFLL